MSRYLMRLDDASEYMDLQKWVCMEAILDKYGIKPIFGIIPKNRDDSLLSRYERIQDFWGLVDSWIEKGWIPAMHGYEHRYVTKEGGINPVNKKSEFAGLRYEEQVAKIKNGYQILLEHGIEPEIFFAPSHTFDNDTLRAIKEETPIRIISDTIAWDVYKDGDFWFIPQQSGKVRKLPFKTVTFCYHPNTMEDKSFRTMEKFLMKNQRRFVANYTLNNRKKTIIDVALQKLYLARH